MGALVFRGGLVASLSGGLKRGSCDFSKLPQFAGITYSARFPLVAFGPFLFLFSFLYFISQPFPLAPAGTQASPVYLCGAGKPLAPSV